MSSKSPCVDLPGFAEPLVRRETTTTTSKPEGILKKGPSVWTKEAETQQKVRNWTKPAVANNKANVKMPPKAPPAVAPLAAPALPPVPATPDGFASIAPPPSSGSAFQNIERNEEVEFEDKNADQDKKPAAAVEETLLTAADIAAAATTGEEEIQKDTPKVLPPVHTPSPSVRNFDRMNSSSSVLERASTPGRISRVKARKSVLEEKGVSMLGKIKKPPKKNDKEEKKKTPKATKKRKQSGGESPAKKAAKGAGPNIVWQGEPADTGIDIDWTGWTKEIHERASGKTQGSKDGYWFTPIEKKKLRSLNEVRRFMEAMKVSGGDEKKAWIQFKAKK